MFLEDLWFQTVEHYLYLDSWWRKTCIFLNNLNNYHPNIKFTHESNKEHIPFLDLNVNLSGNKLSTDLYIKPTDRHQYLHYTSSHPEHTKKSVVYSQALRLSRICSEEKDCEKHLWNQIMVFTGGIPSKTHRNWN